MAWPRLLLCLAILLPTLSGCTYWRWLCNAVQGKPDPYFDAMMHPAGPVEASPSEDTPQNEMPSWIERNESSVKR